MNGRLLVIPAALTVSLVATGCATKKFVREELGKSEVRTEQALGRLDQDLGQAKSQVNSLTVQTGEARQRAEQATGLATEAGGRAAEAGSRAVEALGKATEAGSTAGQALAKADQTDGRLSRLWANRNKRTPGETIVIQFGFDQWQLDDRGETALLDVVKQIQENPELVIDLEGYTDNVGPLPYNVQLSQRRVEAVRRFLVAKGIELHRIQSIGLGHIRPIADNTTKQGREQNRRVALKLFMPAAN